MAQLTILHRGKGDLRSLRPTMRIPFNNRSLPAVPASLVLLAALSAPPAGLLSFARAIHDHLLRDQHHHRRFALPDNATIIHRSLYRVAAGGGFCAEIRLTNTIPDE